MNKLGQEPAFPIQGNRYHIEQGINKRFYVACAAMQALLMNNKYSECDDDSIARMAFNMADEFLKQEEKE